MVLHSKPNRLLGRKRTTSPITSKSNSHVKWLRSLHERRGRESSGALLIEGPKAVRQALYSGIAPVSIAISTQLAETAQGTLAAIPQGMRVIEMTPEVFGTVSDTLNSQGIVAAFPLPHWVPEHPYESDMPVLVLDRVQDPGNVGTLIRTAAAVDADCVLLTTGCADPYSPKVVRSSAGAVFAVSIATCTHDVLSRYLANVPKRVAAVGGMPDTIYEADLSGGCAILIGNESSGLSEELLRLATVRVSIPMLRGIESLNAAVAGSILLYESLKQRTEHAGRSI